MKSMIFFLWFFVVFFIESTLTTPVYGNNPALSTIDFTPEERSYIEKTSSIKMCIDPDWAPFEIINNKGEHEGIAADLIQLVAQWVGLKIELYPVKTWEESLSASKSKQCQIMSFFESNSSTRSMAYFYRPCVF